MRNRGMIENRTLEVITTVGDPGSDNKIVSEQGIREALDEVPGGGDMTKVVYDAAAKEEQLLGESDIVTTVGSPGSDTKLPSEQGVREALNAIDQKKLKVTFFATIASGTTSGTATKPAGAGADVDFIMDEWGTATDALVSTIENGKPTFKSPVDAGGSTITTTFDTTGAFTFSATPSPAADHALIYVYTCYIKNFNVTEALWETELLDYVADHKDTHDPEDGSDKLDTATPAELAGVQAAGTGSSHSFARADHAHQIQHGIADNHIVTIDDANVADDDYAKFTVNGLEGRLASEAFGDIKQAATEIATGVVKIATTATINTGTAVDEAITPDTFAGSNLGTKNVVIKVIADDTALTTGNGKAYFTIPIELNDMNLVSVGAHVYTVSSSGAPTFQIYNLTWAADILSTPITIDGNEKDSKDAVTPAVIDTSEDDVSTGDEFRFDCQAAGTGTKGMEIRMGFRLP